MEKRRGVNHGMRSLHIVPIIDFYVKPLWRKQQSFLRYTE